MNFWSGYYYKLVVDIRTNNGYEFPLYDNGSSIVPDVPATVNGYTANVIGLLAGYVQDMGYEYRIHNAPYKDAFHHKAVLEHSYPLDVEMLNGRP